MSKQQYIYTSLTRISDLEERPFDIQKTDRKYWATGDYVACRITDTGGNKSLLELRNGRMRSILWGESLIGVLGERFATLEATGSWQEVGEDLKMSILTGAGLLGKCTSKSAFIQKLVKVDYLGHVYRANEKLAMDSFVRNINPLPFRTPVILSVGTSMSAGKTTSSRIIAHLFKKAGYRVVGAKLTGAGRYKDILAVADVGADAVFDFVDVGLPSSICPASMYRDRLRQILSRIAAVKADVAIIEIGASPLEPYNGDIAIEALRKHIKCTVLSASDPYAVYGLMKAFKIKPDLVSGIATNTLAGIQMIKKLCGVTALNLIDATNTEELRKILVKKTKLPLAPGYE